MRTSGSRCYDPIRLRSRRRPPTRTRDMVVGAALDAERSALHTRRLDAGVWRELTGAARNARNAQSCVIFASRPAKEETMSDNTVRPANCAACAFWRKLREHEGLCARRAPETSIHPDEPAHFPQTHDWQWCGDGVAAEPMSIGSRCADCAYWRRPEAGLNPLNRRDVPMAWWTRAGICARHAPRPVPEPGARSFWRATEGTDFCAEGQPRHGGEHPHV
jgi:hypothetical protein